jgi:hypothetical protein
MDSANLPNLRAALQTPCMAKLDSLKWVAGFARSSYGVRYGVRVSDPSLIPALMMRLPPGSRPSNPAGVDCVFSVILGGQQGRIRSYNLLYWNHTRIARSHDLDDVLKAFESFVRITVAELARGKVFVHAGVVGWRGQGILIPGRPYSGKTTLVTELVKAGATYYSDEYAVLGQDGRVGAFAKPLSLRNEDGSPLIEVSAESIGGKIGKARLPVGLVVATEFEEGAHWRPRSLSPGQGMLVLLQNTGSARRAPDRALAVLKRVVAKAAIVKTKRGEAAHAAARILRQAEQIQDGPISKSGAS